MQRLQCNRSDSPKQLKPVSFQPQQIEMLSNMFAFCEVTTSFCHIVSNNTLSTVLWKTCDLLLFQLEKCVFVLYNSLIQRMFILEDRVSDKCMGVCMCVCLHARTIQWWSFVHHDLIVPERWPHVMWSLNNTKERDGKKKSKYEKMLKERRMKSPFSNVQ